MQPTYDEDDIESIEGREQNGIDMPRPIVRRAVEDLPAPRDPYYVMPDDAIEPRRLRWWHIAGALLMIAVLLFETLVPVFQGLLEIFRFVPAGGGQAL